MRARVVPRTEFQRPGSRAPAAIWAAQLSVMPARIGVPAGIPVRSAALAETSPRSVPGRATGGRSPTGTPSSSMIFSGQRSFMRSQPVFRAWLQSVPTGSPARREATKSAWCIILDAPSPYPLFNSQISRGRA
ncbi:MAG: hypothetical protein WKF95_00735 [Rubrobacter sp.]